MSGRLLRKSVMGVLVIAAMVGLQACTYVEGPVRPVTQVHPADYYDYYYYPDVDVYYHLYLGHYYYRAGRNWVKVRVLPRHIYLDHHYRIPVHVTYEAPYAKHAEHREKYRPPGKPRVNRDEDRAARDRMERKYNSRQHEEYRRKHGEHP